MPGNKQHPTDTDTDTDRVVELEMQPQGFFRLIKPLLADLKNPMNLRRQMEWGALPVTLKQLTSVVEYLIQYRMPTEENVPMSAPQDDVLKNVCDEVKSLVDRYSKYNDLKDHVSWSGVRYINEYISSSIETMKVNMQSDIQELFVCLCEQVDILLSLRLTGDQYVLMNVNDAEAMHASFVALQGLYSLLFNCNESDRGTSAEPVSTESGGSHAVFFDKLIRHRIEQLSQLTQSLKEIDPQYEHSVTSRVSVIIDSCAAQKETGGSTLGVSFDYEWSWGAENGCTSYLIRHKDTWQMKLMFDFFQRAVGFSKIEVGRRSGLFSGISMLLATNKFALPFGSILSDFFLEESDNLNSNSFLFVVQAKLSQAIQAQLDAIRKDPGNKQRLKVEYHALRYLYARLLRHYTEKQSLAGFTCDTRQTFELLIKETGRSDTLSSYHEYNLDDPSCPLFLDRAFHDVFKYAYQDYDRISRTASHPKQSCTLYFHVHKALKLLEKKCLRQFEVANEAHANQKLLTSNELKSSGETKSAP